MLTNDEWAFLIHTDGNEAIIIESLLSVQIVGRNFNELL